MPIITFVQDAVLGGHLMTMKNAVNFSHRELMNILCWTKANYEPHIKKESYSGLELLSYSIPKMNLNIKISNMI